MGIIFYSIYDTTTDSFCGSIKHSVSMGMADSDYSRHCTDYCDIPNGRTKKIRNAYRADGSYVVRLNLYNRRYYEAIYSRSYFRDCHIQYHLCKCSFLGGST